MTHDTKILKLALIALTAVPLFILIFILPSIVQQFMDKGCSFINILYAMVCIAYIAAMPYFIVLFQAYKLLKYIESNQAFSDLSIKALKIIKYCAACISILFIGAFPLFILLSSANGVSNMARVFLTTIGLILIFGPIIITFFAALLQNLLQNAVTIKNENDLTI